MKFRFPIVIIDEDFRSENTSGLGIRALAQAIEAEGFEVLGVTSYGDLSQFAQQQSRASAFILSIDDEEFTLNGDLTIRGTTRPVSLKAEFAGTQVDHRGSKRAGFEASTTTATEVAVDTSSFGWRVLTTLADRVESWSGPGRDGRPTLHIYVVRGRTGGSA